MIFYWLFFGNIIHGFSLLVVRAWRQCWKLEIDRRATYFGSLGAKLILAPLGMPN
jgi:hypothetical protein